MELKELHEYLCDNERQYKFTLQDVFNVIKECEELFSEETRAYVYPKNFFCVKENKFEFIMVDDNHIIIAKSNICENNLYQINKIPKHRIDEIILSDDSFVKLEIKVRDEESIILDSEEYFNKRIFTDIVNTIKYFMKKL